jgi:hypothetical protein
MRCVLKQVILLAVAGFLAFIPNCSANPIFVNGGFNGNALGWTIVQAGCVGNISLLPGGIGDSGFSNGYGYLSTVGNPAGSFGLNECGSPNDPTIGQTITGLTIGDTYEVGIDIESYQPNSGFGGGHSFGIFIDAEPGHPILTTEFAPGAWHHVIADFTAQHTSAVVMFAAELNGTDVPYAIDNASITDLSSQQSGAVPEPATLLLSASLLGVVLRKRRRSA